MTIRDTDTRNNAMRTKMQEITAKFWIGIALFIIVVLISILAFSSDASNILLDADVHSPIGGGHLKIKIAR